MKQYTEDQAVAALERVAKRWPDTLWLFAAAGSLCVMRKDAEGNHVYVEGGTGIDPGSEIASIDIECDGGDW